MALAFSKLSNLLYLTIIIPLYKTVPSPGNVPVDPKTFQDWFTNHWLRLFSTIVFKKWWVTFIMHRISLNVSNRLKALHSRTANGREFPTEFVHTHQ